MSSRMRCFHLPGFGRALVPVDKPMPEPIGTQVLLKVLASGVCHSDLHISDGSIDLGHNEVVSFESRCSFPFTPGHETSGEVIAVGPEAQGVSVGDKCLVCSWVGCGQCIFCKQDQEHLCTDSRFLGVNRDGGYADHLLVPHARYLIDLGGMDPVSAAPLACSGLTTYSALKKGGPRAMTEPVVIIGAGGLGLMAINILGIMGSKGAVVLEIDAKKRQAALDCGALAAIDPTLADADQQVRQAVGGPIHFVLDLVGSGQTAAQGFRLLDRGGKLLVVGLFGGAMSLSVPLLAIRSVTIEGSYIGSPQELRELIALIQATRMPVVPIDRRRLADANAALQDLRDGRVIGRVVMIP
jgi:D-arabinose 1-dehydrogenase-like Zn-dependent alcohol dehydrogenase